MSDLDQRKEDLETLQALYAHWERGDYGYTDAYAEDVVWAPTTTAGRGLDAGEFKGVEAIAGQWRDYLSAWRDFRVKPLEVIPAPDGKYVVVQVFRGTGKSSGAATEETTGVVFTMRDGKIARMEGYWDRDEALHAAGVEAR